MTTPPDPAAWLEHEHDAERDARRDRLQWIIDSYPESAFGFLLGGGWLSKQLLEEAKYCFVYGQYVATAVLGFALVERLLASEFYAAGRDDLEGATSVNLLREAHLAGRLTAEEYEVFDKLRLLRNPVAVPVSWTRWRPNHAARRVKLVRTSAGV